MLPEKTTYELRCYLNDKMEVSVCVRLLDEARDVIIVPSGHKRMCLAVLVAQQYVITSEFVNDNINSNANGTLVCAYALPTGQKVYCWPCVKMLTVCLELTSDERNVVLNGKHFLPLKPAILQHWKLELKDELDVLSTFHTALCDECVNDDDDDATSVLMEQMVRGVLLQDVMLRQRNVALYPDNVNELYP